MKTVPASPARTRRQSRYRAWKVKMRYTEKQMTSELLDRNCSPRIRGDEDGSSGESSLESLES
jgi:hypothetical protein